MNYEKFDIIYSINCFEHINDLEKAIDNLHNLLKNNGYVFTIFGPIWSSHVGHHLSINSKHGNIYFANNILTPWIHLMGKNYVYE
jgi:2-polyprenyl-3-methyl-5-hydroxy-6-metoxy-1,4-benzoquinol methylase